MSKLRGRFIGVIGGLALVAGGLASTPVITAHAGSGCVTGSGIGLDPIISQSDLLATPSAAYNWAGVTSFCVTNPGTAALSGNPEADITINTGTLPAFPDGRGDVGFTATACSDVTGPMASAPQQIGINHRGQPVFDGPYPPEDGYKVCSYVTHQVGSSDDYGLEFFDPTGNFTFFDYPELCDLSGATAAPCGKGAPTIMPPKIGANSITLHLPQNLKYTVNPPAPPLHGIARNWSEPITTGTPNLQNTFVLMQVQAEANLPMPVCVNLNPPGISCNGNELVGPIFGVAGLLVTSGWAPGQIACNNLLSAGGESIPNPATCSSSGTGGFGNAVDLGILPLPPNAQAITTPCADPLDSPAVLDCAVQEGTSNYAPCQSTNTPGGQDAGDLYAVTTGLNSALPCPVASTVPLPYEYHNLYGRIWPGEPQIPRVAGFTIGPAFLADGANF